MAGGPVQNAPGFSWYYADGHGHRGRHAYNPTINEAMSLRDAAAVRDGKQTVAQVLLKQQTPLFQRAVKNATGTWKVSVFIRMSGAYGYATTGTTNPSYFMMFGKLKKPYEGEPPRGYRAMTTLTRPGRIAKLTPLAWCWDKVNELVDTDSFTRYIVWELI